MKRHERDAATTAALRSIFVGVLVLGLKLFAAWYTASVALFSDALESTVNVVAASALWIALKVAARPADDNHPFGHAKAEHFSAGLEGTLVVFAALAIGWRAVERFGATPRLPELGFGLALGVVATAINLALALYLDRTGPPPALASAPRRCPPRPQRRLHLARRLRRLRPGLGHRHLGARCPGCVRRRSAYPLGGAAGDARVRRRPDGRGARPRGARGDASGSSRRRGRRSSSITT